MPIENYNALELEPEVLEFWTKNKIYEKVKKKVDGKEEFYFLDGPPYTSGKVHIGTAWNKSMKDMFLRFKRMNNINVWDRAGYDMHGLPTAHAVMKEIGITHKDDIPKYGVDKFIEKCTKISIKNMEVMNEDFKRIGIWMDFENAYKSIDPVFMDGEWWLIKKAHENNRLYEGERVMHWCAKCGTALAKHELEYNTLTDDSIFLKFKIKNTENEYLIIWTTTPWTIPYNLGVMVNPEEDYVKAEVEGEVWIVAAKLAGVFIQGVADKKYKILEEFKGESLEGTEYIHPLYDELKDIYDKLKADSPKIHTILLSKEYVDTNSGSGLVHTAPGCGPEDYEVGHDNGILPFNNLDENGVFPKEMGEFAGMKAKDDDAKFIKKFEEKNALIASTPVEHEYAHCWRCHQPVIFRATKQWFFKVEDLKEQLREMNKKVKWQPDWAGSRQFDSWLDNLRDNSITRQRYWGCPVPIWKCSCGHYIVVGSAKELKELSGKTPKDMHIPWIDEIKIKCEKCSEEMSRIPDILDVWVDAGTNSWTCLDYPRRTDLFERLWPAKFILEGKDQIRGWFNLLLINSMVSIGKPSYEAVYMHGWTNDAQGRKMSKSVGNYILPSEVIEKYGADTLRYYLIGAANPGLDINYNFEDMKLKHKNIMVLWNLHKFLIDMSQNIPDEVKELEIEEKYIFSRLNNTIKKVTALFNDYKLNEVPLEIEKLFLDLSRTYIQLVREKSSIGSEDEKKLVAYTLNKVFMECLKMFSVVSPFVSESIYLNLKKELGLKEESIHLFDWPEVDEKLIDEKLEENFEIIGDVIQGILFAREKAHQGLRWPLKEAVITTKKEEVLNAVEALGDIIKKQTNIKEIRVTEELEGITRKVKADYAKIGPDFEARSAEVIAHISTHSPESILNKIEEKGKYEFDLKGDKIVITKDHLLIEREIPAPFVEAEIKRGILYINPELNEELEAEGFAREVMRRVQQLRKNADLEKKDSIILHIKSEDIELNKFEELIMNKCGASKIKIDSKNPAKKHNFVDEVKIRNHLFVISFDKA